MELNLAEIIFLIPFACFLFVLYVYIPYLILYPAICALIGHPFGSRWERVEAEIRDYSPAEALQNPARQPIPSLKVAVYETDGTEYKVPIFPPDAERTSMTLYVKKKNPQQYWVNQFADKGTALISALMILALWAGLVYAGIFIARAIKG